MILLVIIIILLVLAPVGLLLDKAGQINPDEDKTEKKVFIPYSSHGWWNNLWRRRRPYRRYRRPPPPAPVVT